MWYKIICVIIGIISTYILKQLFSKTPNFVKFHLKFLLFYIYLYIFSTLLIPLFVLAPKNVLNALVASQIFKHFTIFLKIKWHLRNGEVLAEDRGAVIVSNHQSSLDCLGMFNIWHVPVKIAVIAKKELLYILPLGFCAYLTGFVFIDKNNSKNAYKQLQITANVMHKNKTKMWIFPEGTRNKDFRKFLPFKKGAFVTAVAAQVPILPVIFSPYYFLNAKQYIFNKGHVIIQCLEPISTEGLTMEDIPDLIVRVRTAMETAYKELSREVLSTLPLSYPLASMD